MSDESDILARIQRNLATHFKIDPSMISRGTRFREDLNLDSIDLFDLLVLFEKETGSKIDPLDLRNTETIGDLEDVLRRTLNKETGRGRDKSSGMGV